MMLLLLAVGALVITAFAVGISDKGLSADVSGERTGQLTVDGVTYAFAPTTCSIAEEEFVAAGSGTINGQTFWVSASRDSWNLTVGPESEVADPDDNELWLTSTETVTWAVEKNTITAAAVMTDERSQDSRFFRGTLDVVCPSV